MANTTNEETTTTTTTTETKQSFTEILKQKFTSRKFIMALIGVITGICGIIGCNDNVTAVIAFAVLEVLSIVAYCIAEGKVDAASVKGIAAVVEEIADLINQLKTNGTAVIPTDPDKTVNDDFLPADASTTSTTTTDDPSYTTGTN